MEYTSYQKKALRELSLCKVNTRSMWNSRKELGYASKGTDKYDINIADDFPNKDCMDVILLHEVGHILYGHVDEVDLKEEFNRIRELCSKMGKKFSVVRNYGGPHKFVNIAMDLQINSTLLTRGNVKLLVENGIEPCTPEAFGFEVCDDFRDYYEMLIKRVESVEEGKSNTESDSNNKKDGNKSKGLNGNGDNSTEDGEFSDGDSIEDERGKENGEEHEGSGCDLNNSLCDLADSLSAFEEDLDEEIVDEIMNESYKNGNSKASEDNILEESTVEGISNVKGIGGSGNNADSYKVNLDTDSSSLEAKPMDIIENSETKVRDFLNSIVNFSRGYVIDNVKHYNRGTRRNNSGILYSSVRRKVTSDKIKLGILVDVSCSMPTESIAKAVYSMRTSSVLSNSVLVTWDDSLRGEFPITEVPNSLGTGYGTDMASGVKYLKEKGFTDIVIYSDFVTDIPTLLEETKDCRVYAIKVLTDGQYSYLDSFLSAEISEFLKTCKKVVHLNK